MTINKKIHQVGGFFYALVGFTRFAPMPAGLPAAGGASRLKEIAIATAAVIVIY